MALRPGYMHAGTHMHMGEAEWRVPRDERASEAEKRDGIWHREVWTVNLLS